MQNISHRKDNPTPSYMLSKFFWQGQFRYYTAPVHNNICLGEQQNDEY
jgi:hypothetical protein